MIVHIIGSGHSGSTLLDMMLGGHSKISSLGEVHSLYFLLRGRGEGYWCTCGAAILECPFWRAVEEEAQRALSGAERPALNQLMVADPRFEEVFHRVQVLHNALGRRGDEVKVDRLPPLSRLAEAVLVLGSARIQKLLSRWSTPVRRQARIARDTLVLYDLVRRAHGTPIIVDSTKNPGTFKNIYLHAKREMRLLFLTRDGRGVCRSRMRRDGVSMREAARIWKREQLKRAAAQWTIPSRTVLHVRYEDLASGPRPVLEKICGFLGIEFEPGMLKFRNDRHNLGGNPMRFRPDQSVSLDEAWRIELSPEDLDVFERVAGRLNRSLGYS